MNIYIKIIIMLCGLLAPTQYVTATGESLDWEKLCPKIKSLVLEIDQEVNRLHLNIQERMKCTPVKTDKYLVDSFGNPCNMTTAGNIPGFPEQLKKIHGLLCKFEEITYQDSLTREFISVFLTSSRLYIMWAAILDGERRDDIFPINHHFIISHYRGYSLAYSAYLHSKSSLLTQCQNQRNFLENKNLIKDVGKKVEKVDQKVDEVYRKVVRLDEKFDELNKRKPFGLTLNYFSGKKSEGAIRRMGLNYHLFIALFRQKFLIIPELAVDFEGDNYAISSLSFGFDYKKSIRFFFGGEMTIPKTGDAEFGAHIGLNILSVRPLIVGVKLSSLYIFGVHLGVSL